jgi:peptide chain release factor 1
MSVPGVDILQLQERYDAIAAELISPSLDASKRQSLQKELSLLSTVLQKARDIEALERQLPELIAQKAQTTDLEFAELIQEEIAAVELRIVQEQKELDLILFPPDAVDDRSVFLEIRAGTGGQEAALFAGDLLRMYTLYAAKKGWKSSVVNESTTDLGGYREVVIEIKGKRVYGHLKHESGVHRVQRVPATETQGRVHTSTATVAVLPEVEDVEVNINPSDLRIDVYRASGAGGQHVNTTDSAVRITHIPTGVVVACQDERSQHKNKAKALKVLQSRIFASMQEKKAAEQSQKRKEMVGSATRSEKVRTYNFPQNRITDHQVDVTLKNLDVVMEGDLDPIIEALMQRDDAERRKQPRTFA